MLFYFFCVMYIIYTIKDYTILYCIVNNNNTQSKHNMHIYEHIIIKPTKIINCARVFNKCNLSLNSFKN